MMRGHDRLNDSGFPTARPAQGWAWILASLAGWSVAFIVALGAGGAVGRLVGSADAAVAHQLGLSVAHGIWGIAGALVVLGVARLTFGWSLPIGRAQLAWLAAGLVTATALELILLGWGYARFGSQGGDPELLGVTTWLAALAVVVALSGFATLIAPAGAVTPAFVVLLISAVLAGSVVASNLPGAADGIEASSGPLAAAVVMTAAYAAATLALGTRRLITLARFLPFRTTGPVG